MGDFYDELKKHKDRYRLTNKDIGAKIGMEGETFRMAVVRKSLSALEMDEIKKMFDESNKGGRTDPPPKDELSDMTDDKAVDYIIEHADRLRKANSKFNMFCELLEVKAERELMRKLREEQ